MNTQQNNIVRHFLDAAQTHPDRIAIREVKGNSITYRELEIEIKKMAAYYRKEGINIGDRVMVFIPMSIDLYRSVLALFYIGATAVFIDEWVDKKRLEYSTSLAHCKAFIGGWKLKALALISKPLYNIPIWLEPSAFKYYDEDHTLQDVEQDHTALLTFTTGSTGKPKAAQRSHGFLHEQFEVLKDKIKPLHTDVAMPVLPIVLLCNLGVGACSIIADYPSRKPTSFKPEKTIATIKKYQVNRITSSPYFAKRIAQYCLKNKIQIPSLEYVFTGGAPVFPDEAKLYMEAFQGTDVQIVYGSTEAEPISSISARNLIFENQNLHGLNVGKIYEKTLLKIVPIKEEQLSFKDEESLNNFELPQGQIGEIIVAGDHVLKSYFKAPEAWKKNKIPAGEKLWHRTSDSGFIDENGNLFLCGRTRQLIPVEDGYLSPFVIEGKLQEVKGINIGTVLNLKNILTVFIEPKDDADKDDILQDLEQVLPKGIKKIKLIKLIPRDPRHHSKIDYEKLKLMQV